MSSTTARIFTTYTITQSGVTQIDVPSDESIVIYLLDSQDRLVVVTEKSVLKA